ncbi:hypothetical protein MY10362_006573 [Beauveria mimosiformis]
MQDPITSLAAHKITEFLEQCGINYADNDQLDACYQILAQAQIWYHAKLDSAPVSIALYRVRTHARLQTDVVALTGYRRTIRNAAP